MYSLFPLSLDERVVIDYLKSLKDGVIINVIDDVSLYTSQFLFSQVDIIFPKVKFELSA